MRDCNPECHRPALPLATFGKGELADKLVAFGSGPNEADGAFLLVFGLGVEHSVGIGNRAFAHAPVGILCLAGFPVKADPVAFHGGAV